MPDLTFTPPTKRKSMSRARAAKVYLAQQGRCHICTRQIRAGEKWEVEHPDPLSLGGSDDDADLRVVCIPCHRAKTKRDAADKAKRDRDVTKGWAGGKKQSSFQTNRDGKYKKKITGEVVER